ncbi:MAG TPA: aldo/keto reductase [Mycobacteriales bacterium]|nr:aldo/keto reductase [Mycobacteriales bacterium]
MTTPASPGGRAPLAGRTVARIGFGAMQLGRPTVDRDTAVALLRQAVAAGVDHIDTAQFYGPCNDLIRDALAPYPADLMLVSKVGADHAGDRLVPAQRPEELRAQVEANLASLGVERLGAVNLRRVDAPPGLVAEGDQLVDIDDQLAELSALRDAGKIGGIGLSNVSLERLRHALPAEIACVQNNYSLLERSSEPLLELCREHGIAWVPFCPLGSAGGAVRLPRPADDPAVIAVAAEIGATPTQVALAWILQHAENALLIAGTSNPAHLAENLAAGDITLPAAALDANQLLKRPAPQ